MKKFLLLLSALVIVLSPALALATNGDNLIGVGPISRAMGGVGIAAPQDAISAVFSNPAAMCFGDFCPSSQVDFAGTAFMPTVHTTITAGNQTFEARSATKVYPIPALGISFNFKELPNWRFGFGAYGVSGMGVDYRSTAVDQPNFFMPGVPLAAGIRSELQLMKFAPTVAYMPVPWLSLGAALHINYSILDLGAGTGSGFAVGAQIGAIVKPHPRVSLGLTYTTPQDVKYKKVSDFNGDGGLDDLKLGSPHRLGFGVAYEPILNTLLLEADVKWLNWSGATGYGDFDWRDQVVFGMGVQYKPVPKLALRLGYNYGRNPVTEHANFNGLFGQSTNVQGKAVPNYYYETFRVTGFPAIVEHHLTFGIGYHVTEKFIINLGYMHAFENTITERGVNLFGQPTRISSRMSEDSIDAGFSIRF
jgi:long-chain fatty acid transport protein